MKNISYKNRRENLLEKSNELQKMNMTNSEKNLIIQIKSQDEDFERLIKITPWGIEGSTKLVNYEEGSETYFGSDEYIKDVRFNFIILNRG
jgi:hypothetical protein